MQWPSDDMRFEERQGSTSKIKGLTQGRQGSMDRILITTLFKSCLAKASREK